MPGTPIAAGRPRTKADRAKADALVDTYASRLSAAPGELEHAAENDRECYLEQLFAREED